MKMRVLLSALAVTFVSACSPTNETSTESVGAAHGHDHDHSAVETLTIEGAYVRPPLGGKDISAGYFSLISPEDDKLVSVTSEAARTIEVHTIESEEGVMRMRKLEALDVKAQKLIKFEPRGLHLMLFGVQDIAEGDTINLTLSFASGLEKTVAFKVLQSEPQNDTRHEH
jgi:copper(I)-binding protein